jgi:DNA-binding XRE family transcriptional regulator
MMNITYAMTDDAVLLEIGWRVKQKRISRQLKQSAMANVLGMSRQTYARAEKGDMKLATLVAILRSLNDLESLDRLLPVASVSPIEQLDKTKPAKQRVRDSATSHTGKVNSTLKSLMSKAAGEVKKSVEKTSKDNQEW